MLVYTFRIWFGKALESWIRHAIVAKDTTCCPWWTICPCTDHRCVRSSIGAAQHIHLVELNGLPWGFVLHNHSWVTFLVTKEIQLQSLPANVIPSIVLGEPESLRLALGSVAPLAPWSMECCSCAICHTSKAGTTRSTLKMFLLCFAGLCFALLRVASLCFDHLLDWWLAILFDCWLAWLMDLVDCLFACWGLLRHLLLHRCACL